MAQDAPGTAGPPHAGDFRDVLEEEVKGLQGRLSFRYEQHALESEHGWFSMVENLQQEVATLHQRLALQPAPVSCDVLGVQAQAAKANNMQHNRGSGTSSHLTFRDRECSFAEPPRVSDAANGDDPFSGCNDFGNGEKTSEGCGELSQSGLSLDGSRSVSLVSRHGAEHLHRHGMDQLVEHNRKQGRAFSLLQERVEALDLKLSLSAYGIRTQSSSKVGSSMDSLSTRSFGTTTHWSRPAGHGETFKPWANWSRRSQVSLPLSLQNRDLKQPESMMTARSMSSVSGLSVATALNHGCVVSPDSRQRLTWELFGMVFLIYDLGMIPLLVFLTQPSLAREAINWTTLLYWTCDILMSLRLGFYTKQGILVLSPTRTALHYLKRWFLFDLLIVIADWVVTLRDCSDILCSAKVMRGLRLLKFFRLLRIFKITRLVNAVRLHINSQYIYMITGVVEYLVFLMLISHLIACCWYWIGTDRCAVYAADKCWVGRYGFADATLWYKYIVSFHWALTQFTPASMHVHPQNVYEQYFAVVVLIGAMVVFGSFISSITLAMTALRTVRARRADQFWLLRKYLKQHLISRELTMQLTRYVTIVVNRQQDRIQDHQVEILGLLSTPLRMRLKDELYSDHLAAHPLLEYFREKCVSILNMICCSAVEEDHLCQHDVLFHCGETAQRMIFVIEGKSAYQREDAPIIVLSNGQWCCEAVLWVPWVHRGDMVALTDCKVLSLSSDHFREVVLCHPAHAVLPRRYAAAFAKKLTEASSSSVGSISDFGHDHGGTDCAERASEFLEAVVQAMEREELAAVGEKSHRSSPNSAAVCSMQRAGTEEALKVIDETAEEKSSLFLSATMKSSTNSSILKVKKKCQTEGCPYAATWLPDYCCMKCKNNTGHGANCEQDIFQVVRDAALGPYPIAL